HFYEWWAVAQSEKVGIPQHQLTTEIAERLRLKALGLDNDNEDLAGVKKAAQVIARGDLARGGRMIRKYMERQTMMLAALDEAKTGRRKQRANAKKSRTDALQSLILEAMRCNQAITTDQLIAELRKHEHEGVIESIIDEEIEWLDINGRVKTTP